MVRAADIHFGGRKRDFWLIAFILIHFHLGEYGLTEKENSTLSGERLVRLLEFERLNASERG